MKNFKQPQYLQRYVSILLRASVMSWIAKEPAMPTYSATEHVMVMRAYNLLKKNADRGQDDWVLDKLIGRYNNLYEHNNYITELTTVEAYFLASNHDITESHRLAICRMLHDKRVSSKDASLDWRERSAKEQKYHSLNPDVNDLPF